MRDTMYNPFSTYKAQICRMPSEAGYGVNANDYLTNPRHAELRRQQAIRNQRIADEKAKQARYAREAAARRDKAAADKRARDAAAKRARDAAAARAQAAARSKAAAQAAAAKRARDAAAKKAQAAAAAKAKRDAEATAMATKIKKQSDNMMLQAVTDPGAMFDKAAVVNVDPNAAGTNISAGTGQLTGAAPQVSEPIPFDAVTVDATKVGEDVDSALSDVNAVQGTVSDDALAKAVTMDPSELAALALEATTLDEAQKVAETDDRVIEDGELVEGSSVDMSRVDDALDFEAAQGTASREATVKGQMEDLMSDFEDGNTPSWASGAIRAATAAMAARGLTASSMAGQAIVQSAMESALPIAMQDAQTYASFEMQNLSNRQQTAMFAAEQRANFLGMEFTQEFQTRVTNAAKISDIANMNFTAEQQVALENARMAQTVDLANMNAVNAKMMADAAAMSQVDITNLNNRQQVAVQNAQAFLAMDMSNADRLQQTEMFKAQSVIQGLFNDQAAENAAKQFNASSENQTNQFFANMAVEVQKFNAGMTVQRDQFNAQNALIVAQANAVWRQNATTANAAAQNASNLVHAQAANNMTQSAIDNIWQRERDLMDNAFRQSESASDRALSVFLSDRQMDMTREQWANQSDADKKASKGYLTARFLGL